MLPIIRNNTVANYFNYVNDAILKKIPALLKKGIDNNLPLIIFSVFYYGVIIFLSAYLNVWEDEVYSLHTSSKTLTYAYHQSIYFEAQPPVYFLLLTLWRSVSNSILWARLFSLFSILLSQFLLFQFVNKVSNKKIATVSSILFLINPFTIFTILEIRLFSFLLLLSLAITILFYNTYYTNNITTRGRIVFILLAMTGLFTQYFFGFLLFAMAVVLMIEKNWRSLGLYILDMIIPLCLVLLSVPQIIQAINVHTSIYPEYDNAFGNTIIDVINVLCNRILVYLIPLDYLIFKKVRTSQGILIILFVASLNYTILKKGLRTILPFFIITLVVMIFFFVVHLLFNIHKSDYKYTTVLFVPLLILMIFMLKFVRPNLLSLWFVIFLFIYCTTDFKQYRGLYKVNDYKSLGKYIERNEKTGEPIFVFRNISAENLGFYYNGSNDIIPIPKAFSYDKEFTPKQWEINVQDINRLNNKLIKYPTFYIVIDGSILTGVFESKTALMDNLISNFTMVEEKPFEEKIVLYKFTKRN